MTEQDWWDSEPATAGQLNYVRQLLERLSAVEYSSFGRESLSQVIEKLNYARRVAKIDFEPMEGVDSTSGYAN